jgi:hypothetical protein
MTHKLDDHWYYCPYCLCYLVGCTGFHMIVDPNIKLLQQGVVVYPFPPLPHTVMCNHKKWKTILVRLSTTETQGV